MKKLKLILKIQKKWLFWLIVVIAALAAAFYIFYLNNVFHKEYRATMAELSQSPNFGPRSRVQIDFGSGIKRAFEGRVLADMSAKIIIKAASEAGGFGIVFTRDQKKLSAVDGIKGEVHKSWSVYLNNEWEKSIDDLSILVRPGDNITLIYK